MNGVKRNTHTHTHKDKLEPQEGDLLKCERLRIQVKDPKDPIKERKPPC